MQELGVVPAAPAVEVCPTPENIHFDNIYDFVAWYSANQEQFHPKQREALDTLLATRDGIDKGCACRRASREHMASAYFATFWTQNSRTDLPETIAKITGAKRVTIGTFCEYPVPA